MQSAITVHGLHKTYAPSPESRTTANRKGTHALKGLNLDIKKGEFFALLGPNGSGKTTFISILAGPTLKSKGTVEILGHDIDTHRVKTKFMLGVVPQEISHDSFFTVNEILELQSGYYGIKNNQPRIDEILSKLGLKDEKHTNSRALSGGMKRRLLIAKALVHNPEVLVLDEPTAGVDVELRRSLWKYMKQLNKEGLTILLTTHYLEEAEQLCERTAIIHKGKLVALDKTAELTKEKKLEDVFVELTYQSDGLEKEPPPNKRSHG